MVEILLVLVLLGLMAGVFVVGAANLIDDKPQTPEDLFWRTVTAVRKQALMSGRDVQLAFVAATQKGPPALVSTLGADKKTFPFEKMGEVKLDFLSVQKSRSIIMIRGQLVETQTLPFVTFYGDGTCTPFKVQLRTGGEPRVYVIDPWTCAQVLNAEGSR